MADELDYYENPRSDLRPLLNGRRFARSLDIGCGAGAVSAALLRDGVVAQAEGVEIFPAAAAQARQRLSAVHELDLSAGDPPLPAGAYDLVLCLDVLEHMVDPWAALARVRPLLHPEGTLVVSLPNVRNFRVVLPLLFKGEFRYEASGLLDRTHLRFFTRRSALELVEGAGFELVRVTNPNRPFAKACLFRLLSLLPFSGLFDFQYVIEARPRKSPSAAR